MNNSSDDQPNNQRPNNQRRTAAAGVGGGLLAGGAIGLLMLAPSLTSAATDQTLGEETAVVALQDDAVEPTDDSNTPAEPDDRVREQLQELVDDDTITAEQADAVAEHLMANRPERADRGARQGRRPGSDGEVLAELLGIEVTALREHLLAGSSIADIAAEQGVDVQTVIDALVAEASSHVELSVENGRLTQDEADERLGHITERITASIDRSRS